MKTSIITSILIIISLYASAQIDTIPKPPGYSDLELRASNILRVSPSNHIWIGYKNIGAGQYDGTTWRMYNDTTGLPTNNVTAFAFSGNLIWMGTDQGGLVKTDGLNIVSYNTFNSPMPSNKINYLFTADSLVWIATDNGIAAYDGTNWLFYNTSNSSLTSDTILCFNKNSYGLYASTTTGIFLLRNNTWKFVGSESTPVTRITSDANDHLFVNSNIIIDTIIVPFEITPDPCHFQDKIIKQNTLFLGGIHGEVYATAGVFPPNPDFVIEYDSLLNVQRLFSKNNIVDGEALIFESTRYQLFDFNSSGELFSCGNATGPARIFKTNFSGLVNVEQTDSCPYLDINQVRARVWNNGSMFWDLEGNALYEVPKGSGTTSIFAEGFWIGGKDDQNKLHIAAQTYRLSGQDFWPGPLDTTNATIDPATFQFYDKIWKIDRYTVLDFIFNFQNGNVTNGTYPIPDIIQNWPAHGNGNISRSLAPFVDFNHDGIYNPMDGDYPDIKGDQMLWWVFNDNYSSHEETGSLYNLGVEIHGSAYAFSCPQIVTGDSVINYTTFYHYDIFNRSDTNYHEVYTSIFTDTDLGNPNDDYAGCDTINDIAFSYNGDNYDDEYLNGYGQNPPMINLLLLKGPEAAPNDTIDNNHNGVIDEPGENCMMNYFFHFNGGGGNDGDPISATEHYLRMQGRWLDGTHLTYGGTGYDPSSTAYTNYMWSGPPYDTINGWSDTHPCNGCPPNDPSLRLLFSSSGPFDLPAHGKKSLDYAYVFTREPNAPNGPNTSLAVNLDQVLRIKQFFNTDSFPCSHLIGIDEIEKKEIEFDLFPNPASSEISVTVKNENGTEKFYSITDFLGREITGSRKVKSSTFRINVQSMAAGLYFVSIRSKNGNGVKKFVVQK